ncbi:MAG: molybdenum cofactor guanylyltransferase [Thermoanaerobaculia bacterium]
MKCYLFIGGQSRRMGTSKAALRLGNETFLQRIARIASDVFAEVVAVQRPDGEPASGVPTIFEHPHAGAGPVFGLARALEDSGGRPFWVLGVDYPLVTVDLLEFLRNSFEESVAEVVLPIWEAKRQYLCAGYRATIAKRVEEVLRLSRPDLRSVVESVSLLAVPEDLLRARFGNDVLTNVNDPVDYELLRKKYEEVT